MISGLTVAMVLIPQSMAYAQLAGLPAYYGLYAAFLPPMVANLFGSLVIFLDKPFQIGDALEGLGQLEFRIGRVHGL